MALTRKQIAAIAVARRQLALTDEQYRAALFRVAGASSSKQLDSAGFEHLVEHFKGLGWKPAFRREHFGRRFGFATPGQVTLIRALWGEFTAQAGTDLTLGRWLQRTFGVSSLRWVTAEQAPKAIAALKAMTRKRAAKAACPPPQREANAGVMSAPASCEKA